MQKFKNNNIRSGCGGGQQIKTCGKKLGFARLATHGKEHTPSDRRGQLTATKGSTGWACSQFDPGIALEDDATRRPDFRLHWHDFAAFQIDLQQEYGTIIDMQIPFTRSLSKQQLLLLMVKFSNQETAHVYCKNVEAALLYICMLNIYISVCVCMYIYIYMCVCVWVWGCLCKYVYVYTCVCVSMYVCVYVSAFSMRMSWVCMCMYLYVYVEMPV